jgi:hypothetical protein
VLVDGQSVAIFNPTIAAGTIMGSSQSNSGFLGLGASHSKKGASYIRTAYPPVAWSAAAAGNHEARCVLNQPKQISDNSLANNVATALIIVEAAPQVVQAKPPESLPPSASVTTATPAAPAISQRTAGPVSSESTDGNMTLATGTRATGGQTKSTAAPPNPCQLAVSYYVPQAPVVESSAPSLQAGDQVQVQCTFDKKKREMEWQQCDEKAKKEIQSLKYSQASGSRYSGIMIIDDANVGVATSPPDGSGFTNTRTWIFNAAGAHEVTCQVDNGLYVAGGDMPQFLQAGASLSVAGKSASPEFRAFDTASARRVSTRSQVSGAEPIATDGRIRLADQPRTSGGKGELINPSLNPQPEVPSSKQVGGNDMVNPSLNPQPEVPSRKLGNDGAIASPAGVPLPDPPSPNLGNKAPENFTSATGAPLVIEAESLIGTAVASAGQIIRQDMAGFGSGWGGNAQLFWRPPAPAASKPHLLTEFMVPGAGTYELVLYYTTAPDFGRFAVYIDGSNPKQQDGYGPQVALRQVVLGRYTLAAGRHELAFEVTGKSGQSTAYIVGIDRLQLSSVP